MAEKKDLRINSKVYTESNVKAPNRAMLRAVGFTDEKFQMPQIGVASNWAETTPCNIHLNDLAQFAKEGVSKAGGVPIQFNTITVADGIAMGTQGMRFSLPSRDIIAYSSETMVGGQKVEDINLGSVFEGVGQRNNGEIDEEELKGTECNGGPGPGG